MILSGQCILSCPNGYYTYTSASSNLSLCVSCASRINNCGTCQYSTTDATAMNCTECIAPFVLAPDGSKCVSACVELNYGGQVYAVSDTNSKYCKACIPGCEICTSQRCFKCHVPMVLFYGTTSAAQCLPACPTGTYQTPTYECH